MSQELVTVLQIALILLVSGCCLGGLVLQLFAWRHLKPGIPRYGHKDALFNKKEEYYTEQGMKYVNLQKILLYGMAGLLVVFFLVTEIGRPPPDRDAAPTGEQSSSEVAPAEPAASTVPATQ